MTPSELANRFTYHPPIAAFKQAERYENIRQEAHNFAQYLNEVVPDSRELSLAITHLEEAVYWANAGIARHE